MSRADVKTKAKGEPVVTIGLIVSALVAVASIFNIAIDPNTLTAVVASLAPIVSAILARGKVTPV